MNATENDVEPMLPIREIDAGWGPARLKRLLIDNVNRLQDEAGDAEFEFTHNGQDDEDREKAVARRAQADVLRDLLGLLFADMHEQLSGQVVCVLPDRFQLTGAKWARILRMWEAGERAMLSPEEVATLFDDGTKAPRPPEPDTEARVAAP